MSAHPIFQRLFADLATAGLIPDEQRAPAGDLTPSPAPPRPTYTPHPIAPVRSIPEGRDDATRDGNATGA